MVFPLMVTSINSLYSQETSPIRPVSITISFFTIRKFDTNYHNLPALTKIPAWLQVYHQKICWKISTSDPILYLTFDDGPHPVATPAVLNLLDQYKIKACFFCIGKHVAQFPDIYQRIIAEGHTVANHSYSHGNGWHMPLDQYIDDVHRASQDIQSNLFRPPYGRITPAQFKALKANYQIIMWDVLSKDYDTSISDENVIRNVTENISKGSIVVM